MQEESLYAVFSYSHNYKVNAHKLIFFGPDSRFNLYFWRCTDCEWRN
jgi:hypothetical protein